MLETRISTIENITFSPTADGNTRAEKLLDGESISSLHIAKLQLRIGAATVRVDGIADVRTTAEHRMRGHSRQVLEATVRHMVAGPAALSVLYGIHDYYHKFGFATAGPDAIIHLVGLDRRPASMPAGWRVQPLVPRHLAAVRRLYTEAAASRVGAAARRLGSPDWMGRAWNALAKHAEDGSGADCRVVIGPSGRAGGYAWRSRQWWPVNHVLENEFKNALVIGEAVAEDAVSADAVLAGCREWAIEERANRETPLDRITLSQPLEGAVARAAMRQDATTHRVCFACGGFMARTLSVRRLLRALAPELTQRARAAGIHGPANLRIETDLGAGCLSIDGGGVRETAPPCEAECDAILRIGQDDLARLALGGFPPDDVLERLPNPVSERAVRLTRGLFPERHPFIFPAERP